MLLWCLVSVMKTFELSEMHYCEYTILGLYSGRTWLKIIHYKIFLMYDLKTAFQYGNSIVKSLGIHLNWLLGEQCVVSLKCKTKCSEKLMIITATA